MPRPGDWSHDERRADTDRARRQVDEFRWDDPLDRSDALFIATQANLDRAAIEEALQAARMPAVPEIEEQFQIASRKLLDALR
ncbi:MAG: hypothetical protein JXR37_08360 [Kiritimatiellae bacterium]|nr:hypothetical protein [Kiritimatiellia bacterium]